MSKLVQVKDVTLGIDTTVKVESYRDGSISLTQQQGSYKSDEDFEDAWDSAAHVEQKSMKCPECGHEIGYNVPDEDRVINFTNLSRVDMIRLVNTILEEMGFEKAAGWRGG